MEAKIYQFPTGENPSIEVYRQQKHQSAVEQQQSSEQNELQNELKEFLDYDRAVEVAYDTAKEHGMDKTPLMALSDELDLANISLSSGEDETAVKNFEVIRDRETETEDLIINIDKRDIDAVSEIVQSSMDAVGTYNLDSEKLAAHWLLYRTMFDVADYLHAVIDIDEDDLSATNYFLAGSVIDGKRPSLTYKKRLHEYLTNCFAQACLWTELSSIESETDEGMSKNDIEKFIKQFLGHNFIAQHTLRDELVNAFSEFSLPSTGENSKTEN